MGPGAECVARLAVYALAIEAIDDHLALEGTAKQLRDFAAYVVRVTDTLLAS